MIQSQIRHRLNISASTGARNRKDQNFSIWNPKWEVWLLLRFITDPSKRNDGAVPDSSLAQHFCPERCPKAKGSWFLNSESKMRNLSFWRFLADSTKWNDGTVPDSSQAQHSCENWCPKKKGSKFLNSESKMGNLIFVFKIPHIIMVEKRWPNH